MTTNSGTSPSISRRSLLAAGVVAGATGLSGMPAGARTTARPGGMALRHVTVIDPDQASVLPDMTVVLRGDRITTVGPTDRVPVPTGFRTIDLRGKFLIPGLCDMHVHSAAEQIDPALHVANGITTVREMAGNAEVFDWRRRIEEGSLLGPRWVIGSRIIDGSPTIWDPEILIAIEVADEAQGRQAVRQVVREGADFVKVYSRVPRAALRGIADEARRQGVPFVGHCPDEVPIAEAATLGQRSFEHLFWTFFGTSSREAEIRAAISKIKLAKGDYNGWFNRIHPLEWTAAHSHSKSQAHALFDLFAERRTRQVPTLTMHHALDNARTLDRDDPRREYLPAWVLQGHDYALDELYLKGRTPRLDAEWAALFDDRLRLVGEMHRVGVPIMTGTDTGTSGVYPGFAIHDELRLLVDAGLTPMAALRAATVEPARFLAAAAGRVVAGNVADLVVLSASPLDDIRNTQRIDGVVVRGRYIGPQERTEILRGVQQAAAAMSGVAASPAAAACPCHLPASGGTHTASGTRKQTSER